MELDVICSCGHTQENHPTKGLWDRFCADFNELCCACVSFIPGKGFKCVCGHEVSDHYYQDSIVSYCDVFILRACGCVDFQEIIVHGGKKLWARPQDTYSDPRSADLNKSKSNASAKSIALKTSGSPVCSDGSHKRR